MSKHLALIATVSALLVGLVFAVLAVVLSGSQSKSDTLIEYLDSHGVNYSSRDDMLDLADRLCELNRQGVDTDSYLRLVFSPESADYIQWGVFNGGYCE